MKPSYPVSEAAPKELGIAYKLYKRDCDRAVLNELSQAFSLTTMHRAGKMSIR